MVSWPVDIPEAVLIDGYSEQLENNVAVFQPEVGPAKRRRRSSLLTTIISMNIIMTYDEYNNLDSFYKNTLKDGTLSFTRSHPRTLEEDKTFVFTNPPSINPVSHNKVVVSLALRGLD